MRHFVLKRPKSRVRVWVVRVLIVLAAGLWLYGFVNADWSRNERVEAEGGR